MNKKSMSKMTNMQSKCRECGYESSIRQREGFLPGTSSYCCPNCHVRRPFEDHPSLHEILAIEYDDQKRPFSIWTRDSTYDVEHSKACGSFYVDVGSGLYDMNLTVHNPSYLWAVAAVKITSYSGEKINRIKEPFDEVDEDGFPIVTIYDLVRHLNMEEENGSVYCGICKDRFPDRPECECSHIFWSGNWGQYGGCGACEHESSYESHKTAVFALVDALGCPPEDLAADLEKSGFDTFITDAMLWQSISLIINGIDYSKRLEYALTELREETYEGYGWLLCLEPGKTDEDIKRTIEWLRGKSATQDNGEQ